MTSLQAENEKLKIEMSLQRAELEEVKTQLKYLLLHSGRKQERLIG